MVETRTWIVIGVGLVMGAVLVALLFSLHRSLGKLRARINVSVPLNICL